MSADTLILRFRDLSTNVGETIRLHQEKIAQYQYAWWGWWRKAGETIPNETFQSFMQAIDKNGHLDILLFDTGTATIYPAKLVGIVWDPRFSDVDSPEWNASPDYYKARRFKAWFKLAEIGIGTQQRDTIRQWSYVEVGEFFETKRSIFGEFDGKQICSLEELRHQERTIWFVRRYKNGDGVQEILLYDSSRVKPSNFPERVIETHSASFLWVSDLHFSNDHHAFPLNEEPQKGNKLAEALRKDLVSCPSGS